MTSAFSNAAVRRPPALVAVLGYGGLIPFVALAIARLFDLAGLDDQWLGMLIGYGAVILSFVGALHWAFAMTLPGLDPTQRNVAYVWSVLPALMGFAALALGSLLSVTLLVAGFALAYWRDAVLANRVALAPWYPRLRAHLSVVASLCLLSALMAP